MKFVCFGPSDMPFSSSRRHQPRQLGVGSLETLNVAVAVDSCHLPRGSNVRAADFLPNAKRRGVRHVAVRQRMKAEIKKDALIANGRRIESAACRYDDAAKLHRCEGIHGRRAKQGRGESGRTDFLTQENIFSRKSKRLPCPHKPSAGALHRFFRQNYVAGPPGETRPHKQRPQNLTP